MLKKKTLGNTLRKTTLFTLALALAGLLATAAARSDQNVWTPLSGSWSARTSQAPLWMPVTEQAIVRPEVGIEDRVGSGLALGATYDPLEEVSSTLLPVPGGGVESRSLAAELTFFF